MNIALGPDTLGDLDRASRLEWLETNALGGFACSTVVGANTRRYHGLLTAALDPPVRRHLLLSRVEEIVEDGSTKVELGCNFYPGTIHPRGFEHQIGFRLDPFPIFTWQVGNRRLEKACFVVHGQDTVVLRYSLLEGAPFTLRLRPFLAFRDSHSLQSASAAFNPEVRVYGGVASVQPVHGLPGLFFHGRPREVLASSNWWKQHRYPIEEERGLDSQEDLWSPLEFSWTLGAEPIVLVVSTGRTVSGDPATFEAAERQRRATVVSSAAAVVPTLDEKLALAADSFLVRRGAGSTVIAGYPWFADWGRDTMISLPGLCLALGRTAEARDVLCTFARFLDGGMIPNRFPDEGQAPEYNNVDGTLWFVHTIGRYLARTRDLATAESVFLPAVSSIIACHRAGTRYGIHVTPDGLLSAGADGVQLTWMDAKVDNWVVTPRRGKPVEVNALWIEALETALELCRLLGKPAGDLSDLLAQARESFGRRFWFEGGGYLYDVVDSPDGDDRSLRPNQVFAFSLPHPALAGERAAQALAVVEKELLTPVGLRTLSPRDPRYRGSHSGDRHSRDSSYHQGTVWPWLMGPFVRAWLRVHGKTPETLASARRTVQPLLERMNQFGLGQVAEVCDGDAPHTPRGCPAQAWSVAELIAVMAEELG